MNYPIRTFVEIEQEELNQLKQTIIRQKTELDEATTVLYHQERELELAEKRILDAFDSGRLFERTKEKNLTNAEIWSISAMYGDLSWRDFTLDFARAILRKAQKNG